ncbi:MAG: formylglycine-generating enzyme family protein [Planctomycetes bacterium]|nr:formylglycine-generating enzyme family protein [Planctomycetota bacterium]
MPVTTGSDPAVAARTGCEFTTSSPRYRRRSPCVADLLNSIRFLNSRNRTRRIGVSTVIPQSCGGPTMNDEKATAAAVKKHMTPDQLALGDPVVDSIGMVLVPVPAGEFQMGSPDSDSDADDDEKPQHLVKITEPFYLSAYVVTQQEYEKVMGVRPWQGQEYVKEGPDNPATNVSHDDAVEFCRKLSETEGVEYRLPTEAEWEYACRAGTTTVYSFGDDASKLRQYAWYDENAWDVGEEYAHRVGQKLPNPWGLFDMHGNVWELCQDGYASYGSEKVVSDPMGPAQGDEYRVLRGGSFDLYALLVRSAYRLNLTPVLRNGSYGFRVARTYA